MSERPQIGEVWQHFKGTKYRIVGICKDCDDGEDLPERVLYASEKEPAQIWGRPLAEFVGEHKSGAPRFVRFVQPPQYRVIIDDIGEYCSDSVESLEEALDISFDTWQENDGELPDLHSWLEDDPDDFYPHCLGDWSTIHDGIEFDVAQVVNFEPGQHVDIRKLLGRLHTMSGLCQRFATTEVFPVSVDHRNQFREELACVFNRFASGSFWSVISTQTYVIRDGKPVRKSSEDDE